MWLRWIETKVGWYGAADTNTSLLWICLSIIYVAETLRHSETESWPSCSHIESKQSFRTWLVQNRERESENITAGKYQTKAVAAERFVKELLEKNSYQSRFRISYNACQLKGNNSQTMYLTLLYCEKPMLLNLICLTCQN